MKNLIELTKTMFRIGCIGFGGGSALIPVIEEEVVTKQQLITEEDYNKNIVVSSVTPGALSTEIAAGVGLVAQKEKGMVVAATSMSLPGAALTILFLTLFSAFEAAVLEQIQYLSIGVGVFIIYLLMHYISNVLDTAKKYNQVALTIGIILAVFLLNGGKELNTLLGLDRTPIFDVASIQIMGVAFFGIFFLADGKKLYKVMIAGTVGLLYLLCVGKSEVISSILIEDGLKLIMVLLAVIGLLCSLKNQEKVQFTSGKSILKVLIVWLIFLVCCCFPAFLISDQTLLYVGRGLLSAAMSFGGGDAYLSVAEGLFVSTGMLDEATFYGQLITVVNILPGSILCKTLAGAGYLIGYHLTGDILTGVLLALAGFGASIVGSCGISVTCLLAYSQFENIVVFGRIGRWIRPIISGLLISISISLFNGNVTKGNVCGMPIWMMLILCVVVYAGIYVMDKKKKLGYGFIVAMAAIFTFIVCNLCVII